MKLAREAREIAGEPAFVAGSVGPIGRALEPFGDVTLEAARDAFREQIDALLEGGADLIILETFSLLDELLAALAAARAAGDLPVVAQVTIDEDGRTLDGQDMGEVARALEGAGASVVGVNCGVGPQGALAAVEAASTATTLPISAMPNAGLPQRFGGRFVYFTTPAYFGDYAGRLVAAGARVVGGCCGTTPAHVAAMRRCASRVAARRPRPAPAVRVEVVTPERARGEGVGATDPPGPPVRRAASSSSRSSWIRRAASTREDAGRGEGAEGGRRRRLQRRRQPDGPRADELPRRRAARDGARPGSRRSSTSPTRDRNLMALQSELIGAHATGHPERPRADRRPAARSATTRARPASGTSTRSG